ncbi:MAG: hypothetical protein NTX25_23925, partial [Proteobacteria bacterium]|nr:hypothetical protein [Pseudomonadota bacterium]
MKTIVYFTSLFACLVACSADKKPGNSPYFADDATLTVSGQFLDKDEKPLAARNIVLKNLRRFAYFDPTLTYFKESLNWFAHLAFPMFPSYELSYDSQKAKPNYFIKNVVTANDGSFRFQMRADQTMRDSEGGINITLVNDGEGKSASYAKYNFVIKAATSTLDPIHLCSLGDVFQEGSDSLNWTWTTPTYSLDHYE